MDEPLLSNLVPKVPPFLGDLDLEVHLKAFRTQMLISRGALMPSIAKCLLE